MLGFVRHLPEANRIQQAGFPRISARLPAGLNPHPMTVIRSLALIVIL